MDKIIKVSEELHKKLAMLKAERGFKSLDELIKNLIKESVLFSYQKGVRDEISWTKYRRG